MSLLELTGWGLLRALLVASVALAVGWRMGAQLATWRGRTRVIGWCLLLAPLCTPALLVSYGYAQGALAFAPPVFKEAAYALVLTLRLAPIAALARYFFPPRISREASFCYALAATAASRRQRLLFGARAAGPAPLITAGALFLLAFAEFELASLWAVKTWTVSLFDAHAGGLRLGESLQLVSIPLACQLVLLACLAVAARNGVGGEPLRLAPSTAHPAGALLLWWLPMAAVTSLFPLAHTAAHAVRGLPNLLGHGVFWEDFAVSVSFAAAAAMIAWFGVGQWGRWRFAAAVPGLLGALVVALLVLALFQQAPFRAVYDTPLPLLLALVLLLLPLAMLLRRLLATRRPGEALHLARLLRHRALLWELEAQRRAGAVVALFMWAYFDFTASSLLAPVGLTPVFVRLHNLAHYGQNAVLSAMLLTAVAIPAAVAALTLGASRLYPRSDAR